MASEKTLRHIKRVLWDSRSRESVSITPNAIRHTIYLSTCSTCGSYNPKLMALVLLAVSVYDYAQLLVIILLHKRLLSVCICLGTLSASSIIYLCSLTESQVSDQKLSSRQSSGTCSGLLPSQFTHNPKVPISTIKPHPVSCLVHRSSVVEWRQSPP